MQFETKISKTLHDEHLNTMDFLERFESQLLMTKPGNPPDLTGSEFTMLLRELIHLIEAELHTHFKFEEEEIFPLLDRVGNGEIVALLKEEHETIVPVCEQLITHIKQALTGGFSNESWNISRLLALELVERLVSHIQKEEMGMLPMIDSLLDEDQDTELSNSYAMIH